MPCEKTRLIQPDPGWSEAYDQFLAEFSERGEPLVPWVLALDAASFAQLVSRLEGFSRGVDLPLGFVPNTTFWLVDSNDSLLGVSNLRHRLTPSLEQEGGHIGFGVRPSQRCKGHASRLLTLTLSEARALGIERVLLTCDRTNRASARVIMKNGGVLESESERGGGRVTQRYWIKLV